MIELFQVVKDKVKFPSPVTALGSLHTVTEAIVNDGGTVLLMGSFAHILGLEER